MSATECFDKAVYRREIERRVKETWNGKFPKMFQTL